MTIYENYYVGAFIHAAGYQAGLNRAQGLTPEESGTAVGLNQQQPKDGPLGDLYWGSGGRHLLIEFKARFKGIDRERAKAARTHLLNRIKEEEGAELRKCADAAHYFAVGGWKSGGELLRIGPYSLLAASTLSEQGFATNSDTMTTFITKLVSGELGADVATFRKYLALLDECVDAANAAAAKKAASSGKSAPKAIASAKPGGLLVSVTGPGEIKLLPFDGLEMLQQLEMNVFALHPDVSLGRSI